VFAAAVKKNLALFLKRVKRVFGWTGNPQPCTMKV